MTATSTTSPLDPQHERQALADSERRVNRDAPRNFKADELADKVISVEPDGTGPTPTESFDTDEDRRAGAGSGTGQA